MKHDIRDQIVAAAMGHVRVYGFDKMVIAELATNLGFSKAYIYKFFASKQAIGEVIACQVIGGIVAAAESDIIAARSASDKLKRLFRSITRTSLRLMQEDRHLYDIVALASVENWPCGSMLDERIKARLAWIILDGREAGEFELKTPLDETCRAIAAALRAHTHPLMLLEQQGCAAEAAEEVIGLVLRSLSSSPSRYRPIATGSDKV